MKKMLAALSLVPLLAIGAPAFAAELIQRPPIPIPADMPADKVETVIKQSLAGRKWTITGVEAGVVHTTLHNRKHVVTIDVEHGAEGIVFKYIDSTKMKYKLKGDVPHIHRSYNKWIRYLDEDIRRNLGNAAYL